ncbi:hypothetical protein LUZ63_009205 [Rhynchospora breviuscula]|uniref:phospholipase A2 n=1 Tax=Rhynchospora breviuscula TaxID=2022672 RepID=A0A9Q0CEK3_9POAL|nr:hypothetical protein LUZ63_009205 [Rhynchospora breviuscula]
MYISQTHAPSNFNSSSRAKEVPIADCHKLARAIMCRMQRSKPSRLFPSTLLLLLLFLLASCCSAIRDHARCSRSCVAKNCNSLGIRYGKYCGVGWSGCPGEKPCDDLDACCMGHDKCVGSKGITSVWCHKQLKRCIYRVKYSGKIGFSNDCPSDVAMRPMIRGMNMAILLSRLFG